MSPEFPSRESVQGSRFEKIALRRRNHKLTLHLGSGVTGRHLTKGLEGVKGRAYYTV